MILRWCFVLLLLSGFWGRVTAQENSPGPRINHSVNEVDLRKVLRFVSRAYQVRFAYDPRAMSRIDVTGTYNDLTVSEFLEAVLSGTGYGYKRIGNTFVIVPQSVSSPSPSGPERYNIAITGRITDKRSGEPLPYASISVVGTTLGTSTSLDGRFTLLGVPTDTSTLQVSFLGYFTRQVKLTPVDSRKQLVIELEYRSRALPPIEIRSEETGVVATRGAAGQLTINPGLVADLPARGEPDVLNALGLLPGISSTEENIPGLRIRGAKTDQSLVVLDGFTVYHIDHFFGAFSAFNPAALKSINLSKGYFDAGYGGRTAGLLELTAIEGNKQEAEATANLSPLAAQLTVESPIQSDRASVMVSARRSYTDLVATPVFRELFNTVYSTSVPNPEDAEIDLFQGDQEPQLAYYDIQSKITFTPTDNDHFSLSFFRSQDNLSISFEEITDNFRYRTDDNSQWGNTGLSARWVSTWSNRLTSTLSVAFGGYQSELKANESLTALISEARSERLLEQESGIDDFTVRSRVQYKLKRGWRVEGGVDYTNIIIRQATQDQTASLTDSASRAVTTSPWLQATYQKFDLVEFTAGWRNNFYSPTNSILPEPRFSLRYKASSGTWFKAAGGIFHQTMRRITEQGLYLNSPETWAHAPNNNLPILRSAQYAIGLVHLAGNFTVDAELFVQRETGTIDFLYPELFFSAGQPRNLVQNGNRRSLGLDLLVKYTKGRHLAWSSYTFSNNFTEYANLQGGDFFPSFNDVAHEVKLTYQYSVNQWLFSLTTVTASGRPYTPVLGSYTLTIGGEEQEFLAVGNLNSRRSPVYHRSDVSARFQIPLKKSILQVGFSVYNFYNYRNINTIDYYVLRNPESDEITIRQRGIEGLGITPTLLITWKL